MRRFVIADEAGCLEFSKKPNVSKYFIACAVVMDSCDIGIELLNLRRELAWEGAQLNDFFHATQDTQYVRDKVFALIQKYDLAIYAQVIEKSKAQPSMRPTRERFYKYAWFYLFKHNMARIVPRLEDQLMVTIASIGTKKGQVPFSEAILDVVQQTQKIDAGSWRTSFCQCSTDPCLQIADYCTWAIQRKWERGDSRSYDLVKDKIKYEYNLWGHGTTHYY